MLLSIFIIDLLLLGVIIDLTLGKLVIDLKLGLSISEAVVESWLHSSHDGASFIGVFFVSSKDDASLMLVSSNSSNISLTSEFSKELLNCMFSSVFFGSSKDDAFLMLVSSNSSSISLNCEFSKELLNCMFSKEV